MLERTFRELAMLVQKYGHINHWCLRLLLLLGDVYLMRLCSNHAWSRHWLNSYEYSTLRLWTLGAEIATLQGTLLFCAPWLWQELLRLWFWLLLRRCFGYDFIDSFDSYNALALPWGSIPATDYLLLGSNFNTKHDWAGFLEL